MLRIWGERLVSGLVAGAGAFDEAEIGFGPAATADLSAAEGPANAEVTL